MKTCAMASKIAKDKDSSTVASKSGGVREELVGKRFLLVNGGPKPKITRVQEWSWKAGVIRCASHVDCKDPDLQVLVEFDLQDWQKRDWLNVYKDNSHLLLIEENLVLAPRTVEPFSKEGVLHPALTFKPLVDNVGLWKNKHNKPVEFLGDLRLDFQDCNKLRTIRHWDPTIPGINQSAKAERCINAWSELQDGQQILITTPSVLLGFRTKVYRAEGTTQWYTAVTTGYNETTSEFTLTDDTVLEEHYEDPRLTQMVLLGDGVVSSILRGENIGITPRRSRASTAASSASSSQIKKQSNKFPSIPSRNPSSQNLASTNRSGSSTSAAPNRRGGPGRGHTGPRDRTISNVTLKLPREKNRTGHSSLGDSLSSSSSSSSPEQSPTALSPPKDHLKISQKQSSSSKPSDSSVSTISPSLSKPKSVTSSRSQSTEDLPIASTLSRSRSRHNKITSPTPSTSSGSSTTTSQKRSQSNTKRDHLSADKEQKNSTSNENDTPSLQKFNKTRLRRSNSSVPNISESSLKAENNKSKSLEEDTEKEDVKTHQRGRKRLKTRSSRNTERDSTDLSPSLESKTDSSGIIKRTESATSSSSSTKDSYDTINNRQRNKIDGVESNQFASLHTNLTDSTRQEKTNLPPSRTASLNSSSNSCSTSKRKAVAIVRPQPQQLKQDPSQVDSRKLSSEEGQIDLQTQLDKDNLESAVNEKLISKGETKFIGKELKKSYSRSKIKSLSPKGELRKVQKNREDRFSLYDFPSDSEAESDSSPPSLSPLVKDEGNSSTNVIVKSNPEKSKLSQTELRAASNNNSSIDCLLVNQHSKIDKEFPSQSPPLGTTRLASKIPADLTSEQPHHKGISTLASIHGSSSHSRLPITTIARSFSSFDTKTTTSSSSTSLNANNSQNSKDNRHKSRSLIGIGSAHGVTEPFVGSHNKDAKSRKPSSKDNTFTATPPTTVNSSNYSSSGTPISSVESLRMQTDTNTVSASSSYHPSHLSNPSHHQGDQNTSSASFVNLRDDRSDSGLSTLRSDGARSSGDERSGSRSSAVSDEILLRTAAGPGATSQSCHAGRPNSANALELIRLPNHTPPTSISSLNPPFGSISASSRPLHPPSSSASPTWKDLSAYNKHSPGQLPSSISKTSKLPTLPPMSSETRPPPPSAIPRGGTSGVHHNQSSVAAVGAPPPAASSSITSQQHAAVAAAMSAAQQQQWASVAAAHQYQAALQAASLVASQQPSQVAQQALLNQYQSLAAASAAGITPEVLKQFPHLATGLPPHLLPGRGPTGSAASAAHHDILIAREREMAERERVHRERRENEQRLERDRIEKERIEKERLERERRERERREERERIEREQRREQDRRERERKDQMSKVDEHFKLSMEYHNKYDTYLNTQQRMNATTQAMHWSQQLSSAARNPMGGSSIRPSNAPQSMEVERQRYESERRLTIEAEQNRQYLNALASNRHPPGALPPPPAHSSISSRTTSKQPTASPYLPTGSSYKSTSRHDPGPPPPLLRTDGSSFLSTHSANQKPVHDLRYPHLPPNAGSYKPSSVQNYDKEVYGSHHPHPASRREPSPNNIPGSNHAHPAVPSAVAAAHAAVNQRGISPANSISPPDHLRRAATQLNAAQQQYKHSSSSYSPGNHSHPSATPPLPLQNRASPVSNNSGATRQRVNSPAAPGQIYGKPNIPSRTTEGRPTYSPSPNVDLPVGASANNGPPPAHGGSTSRLSSHDHHNDPRNDPRYLLPSTHLSSQKKHYLPSPSLSSQSSYTSHSGVSDGNQHRTEDVPLDLGVSNKRRYDGSSELESKSNPGLSPRKNPKFDGPPGVLFKVSEPSVLITSEPSTITTVINSALVNDTKSVNCNMPHNLSGVSKPVANSTLDDQHSQKSAAESESSASQRPGSPISKPVSPLSKDELSSESSKPAGYVHKLKKAWIQAYSTNDDTSNSSSAIEKPTISYNNSPTPNTARATPSPSLSNRSSASTSSSTVAGKRGAKTKTSNQSRTPSKPGTPQSLNGHSASPRRAGGSKNNKETDYGSDVSSDTGEQNPDSSGEDEIISLRSKRSSSVTSAGSKKKAKKGSVLEGRNKKRSRIARTRNARNSAIVRNRKNTSEESSGDEEMSNSDTSKRSDASTNRKRGRKPGSSTNKARSNKDEPRTKKEKIEGNEEASQNNEESTNPFQRPQVSQLKKTGESFLQDKPCLKEAPRLAKCLECRLTDGQRNKQMPNIFCRFYAFRRLKYAKNGQVCVAGFCDPDRDYGKDDIDVWNVSQKSAPKNLTVEMAKYLLENTRTDFDLIIQQERRAVKLHSGEEELVAWKRMVQGVREMCDVCEANLFNYHWACGRCGFVVCIDCYQDRKNDLIRKWPNAQHAEGVNGGTSNIDSSGNSSADGKERDNNKFDQKDKFSWLLCINKGQHDIEKLMLTQIIPGNTLEKVYEKLNMHLDSKPIKKEESKDPICNGEMKSEKNDDKSSIDKKAENIQEKNSTNQKLLSSDSKLCKLEHYVRPSENDYSWNAKKSLGIKSYSLSDTKSKYPKLLHSWLCYGHVLKIDSNNTESPENQATLLSLFRDVWQRGQPVIFSDICRNMDLSLWSPHRMAEDFGDVKTEFIDSVTGESLGNHVLKRFFDGFSVTSRRTVKNREGKPAIVRLNDWPAQSGDDFMNSLPIHTTDFQKSLPLPIYTSNKESSFFNLSASLPEVFMRPDVGPRALFSHGPAVEDDDGKASFDAVVNLSSESCDTLSLLAHAEVPRDLNRDSFRTNVINLMKSNDCDPSSCRRVIDAKELPGILWHIFHPSDADKIKDFLSKTVSKERKAKKLQSKQAKTPKKRPGRPTSAFDADSSDDSDTEKLDQNFDVIQEESHYLDEEAIETLKKEYGVTPFVIAQFPGEAIMLPAGAPFQMKHILSCISLSSDFVSPEHISHSFYLTRQMRFLSEQQMPAEDKIQIKNLIYHSVKNALSTLDTNSSTEITTKVSQSPIKEEKQD